MPRNLSYRRPIEAIRAIKMKPVVTKRSGTVRARTNAPKSRRKPCGGQSQ